MLSRISCTTAAGLVLATVVAAAQAPRVGPALGAPPAPPQPQAQAEQAPPPVTFRVEINYVEVNARVVDRDGSFVRNLKKEDFQLFEDGKPQTVATFGLVDMPVVPLERPKYLARGELPIEQDVVSNKQGLEGRLYLILLDDYHINPVLGSRARDIARRFILEKLDANDQAAIVVTSGNLKASQEFTRNRRLLVQAVDNMFGRKLPSAQVAKAQQMANDNAARATSQESTTTESGGTRDPLFDMRNPNDPDEAQRNYYARAALTSLKSIAQWMSAIQGRRKSIVYISEGFDYELSDVFVENTLRDPDSFFSSSAGSGVGILLAETKEAIDTATRNNVTIYAIDPRGLSAAPGFDAEFGAPITGFVDLALANRTTAMARELQVSTMSLNQLATETGGFAAVNRNDLPAAMDRIVEENSSYYLLGYYPTNDRRDGRIRKIDVRIPGRENLQIVHRKGYAAPRGNPRAAAAPKVTTAAQLFETMVSPLPVTGLTLAITTVARKGAGRNAELDVFVEAAGSDLTFKQSNGTFNDVISISIAAFDKNGKRADKEKNLSDVELTLRPETYSRVSRSGVRAWKRLGVLAGQQYQIRIAARETGGAKTGSANFDIEVPDFSKGKLGMSGVALAAAGDVSLATFNNPFAPALPVAPTVLREFPSGDELAALVEVYDNQPTPVHRLDITTTVRADDGTVVFTNREERSSEDLKGKPGGFGYGVRLPLRGWTPGLYVLTIEANSRVGAEAPVSKSIQFKVAERSGASGPPRAERPERALGPRE